MKKPIVTLAAALFLHSTAAFADVPPSAATGAAEPPETIEVAGTKSPGSIEYKGLYKVQQVILGTLPPEPRHIDIKFRTGRKDTVHGANGHSTSRLYLVGNDLDQPIPVDDNGFFILPELPPAYREKAIIQSNERKSEAALNLAILIRTNGRQRLPYRDLAQAIDEATQAASKLPWYVRMLALGSAKFETAAFCFKEGGGVKIGSASYMPDAKSRCARFDFDRALAAQNADIEINGKLAYASLELKQAEKIAREP
ncbi:MAG TPA: hypothetical protein VEC06_13000 [Paucimonas sp.]|nr:hypothetical protein [Paucimonas sp.]